MLLAEKNMTLEFKGENTSKTINRTLKTAKRFDAFWERWLVHGLDRKDLDSIRPKLQSLEQWFDSWEEVAEIAELHAQELEDRGLYKEAEKKYRQIALYYNLNYWIDPMFSDKKQFWYIQCLRYMNKADSLSEIETLYRTMDLEDSKYAGRIRVPKYSKGCILIINPIDSSKEELYKYEMDFVDAGYTTVSFDGPGQGETFILNGVIGTRVRWEKFINQLIEYTNNLFPSLPIFLFGTSLGASWAIYGSSHRKVKKVVAVSPAVELEKMNMPGYFMERMDCSCNLEEKEIPIPKFLGINYQSPLLVFHGKQDMMVPNEKMYELFQTLPMDKRLTEYEEEGHCCNNRLDEIRGLSLTWFSDKNM